MDYILFIRAPPGGLTLQPNPEEVMVSLAAYQPSCLVSCCVGLALLALALPA